MCVVGGAAAGRGRGRGEPVVDVLFRDVWRSGKRRNAQSPTPHLPIIIECIGVEAQSFEDNVYAPQTHLLVAKYIIARCADLVRYWLLQLYTSRSPSRRTASRSFSVHPLHHMRRLTELSRSPPSACAIAHADGLGRSRGDIVCAGGPGLEN